MRPGGLRRVLLETPYDGDLERNIAYCERAIRHSMSLNESPISLLWFLGRFPIHAGVEARSIAIRSLHAWIRICDCMVMYRDYGLSDSMNSGITQALRAKTAIEYRFIGTNEAPLP